MLLNTNLAESSEPKSKMITLSGRSVDESRSLKFRSRCLITSVCLVSEKRRRVGEKYPYIYIKGFVAVKPDCTVNSKKKRIVVAKNVPQCIAAVTCYLLFPFQFEDCMRTFFSKDA